MADQTAYGLDPRLTNPELVTLTQDNRREVPAGMGFGVPVAFEFSEGPLGDAWTTSLGPGSSVEQVDGVLHYSVTKGFEAGGAASAYLVDPFTLIDSSVTFSFALRSQGVDFIKLMGNLVVSPSGGGYFIESATQNDSIGFTRISNDQTWHKIVVTFSRTGVTLWEDGTQVFDTPLFKTETWDSVATQFGARINDDGDSYFEIKDLSVLVGTLKRAQLTRSATGYGVTAYNNLAPKLADLKPALEGLQTSLSNLTNLLMNFQVTPWNVFWGIDPSPEITAELTNFLQGGEFANIALATRTIVSDARKPATYYVGAGVAVTAGIQAGGSLGFLIDTDLDNHYKSHKFVFVVNGGLETNIGVGAALQFSYSPGVAESYTGFGAYVQIVGGELGTIGGGWQGNVLWNDDNSGPMFSLGVGGSVLPGDIGGGVLYVTQLA